MCVRVGVCCSDVCGTEFSVVLVTRKVESSSVQLTLTRVLDTRPVLTFRFMCNPWLCLSAFVCACEQALVSWPVVFAESRCLE